MLFKIIKDWFNFSADKKDELTHVYKKYNINLDLLEKKVTNFLKEQYDDIQTKKFEQDVIEFRARRTSLLRRYTTCSVIFIQFKNISNQDLVLKIVLDKKPKHDLWTVTDPWQNGIREDKLDFRNFLLGSIVQIVSSLKDSNTNTRDR